MPCIGTCTNAKYFVVKVKLHLLGVCQATVSTASHKSHMCSHGAHVATYCHQKAVSVPAADAAAASLQQPAPSSSSEVTTQGGLMAWVLWVPTVLCDMADVPQIWWPLVCHCNCHAGSHITRPCMIDLRMSNLCIHMHVYCNVVYFDVM